MSYELLFLKALGITVTAEFAVIILITQLLPAVRQMNVKIFRIVAAGVIPSVLTLPYLWFVLPFFITDYYTRTVSGELGIFLVETLVIKSLTNMPLRYAILISFVANCISIISGLIIFR